MNPKGGRRDGGRPLLAPAILECIQKIQRFTADGKERFLQEPVVQDAVIRNSEIIGEAAKRLDDAGLRDVLIHRNEGVGLERVWAIVERDLPVLKEAIAAGLPPLDRFERELAGEDGPAGES